MRVKNEIQDSKWKSGIVDGTAEAQSVEWSSWTLAGTS